MKRKRSIRSILVGILGLIFFSLLLVIPTVFQVRSFPFGNIDPLQSQSVIDEAVSLLKKCQHKSFIPMDDRIFFGISIVLTIIFILLAINSKRNRTEGLCSFKRKATISQPNEDTPSGTNRPGPSIQLERHDTEHVSPETTHLLASGSCDAQNQLTDDLNLSPSVRPVVEKKFLSGILLSSQMKLIF